MADFKSKNKDGSTIVELSEPITVRGEEITRVTIPKLRGKHLFHLPIITGATPIGKAVEWATHVVLPEGAIEEMAPKDAAAIAHYLIEEYLTGGKARATSDSPSV